MLDTMNAWLSNIHIKYFREISNSLLNHSAWIKVKQNIPILHLSAENHIFYECSCLEYNTFSRFFGKYIRTYVPVNKSKAVYFLITHPARKSWVLCGWTIDLKRGSFDYLNSLKNGRFNCFRQSKTPKFPLSASHIAQHFQKFYSLFQKQFQLRPCVFWSDTLKPYMIPFIVKLFLRLSL